MARNHLQAPRDERGRHVVLPPAMRDHMWVKGQPSPNPSGKSGEFQRCRSLCREASYNAAQELIRLGLESEDERVRFMANSWVYEHAWGKPKDYDPRADHDRATTAIDPSEFTSEQRAQIMHALRLIISAQLPPAAAGLARRANANYTGKAIS